MAYFWLEFEINTFYTANRFLMNGRIMHLQIFQYKNDYALFVINNDYFLFSQIETLFLLKIQFTKTHFGELIQMYACNLKGLKIHVNIYISYTLKRHTSFIMEIVDKAF